MGEITAAKVGHLEVDVSQVQPREIRTAEVQALRSDTGRMIKTGPQSVMPSQMAVSMATRQKTAQSNYPVFNPTFARVTIS